MELLGTSALEEGAVAVANRKKSQSEIEERTARYCWAVRDEQP
jgi:hypothetical protein